MPRRIALFATSVLMLALVSACTNQVGGEPTVRRVPGTIQASMLSVDEVSVLVGVTLTNDSSAGEPPVPFGADPATCAVAVGPATRSVYTNGWTAFGSEFYADVNGEYVVTQVLGLYPDAAQAAKVFTTLADGVKACPSAVRTDEETTSKWTYTVDTAEPSTLVWTATQDAADGWACYRHARLKGKAVLQVAVCQAGSGKQATSSIAARFAERVEG